MRNISLILRWWWKAYAEPESLWTTVITKIRWTGIYARGPSLWAANGSFFWRQLLKIKHIFNWCTQWRVGDGKTISFWFDSWKGMPLATPGIRPHYPTISLRDAAPMLQVIAPNLNLQQEMQFTDGRDEISWQWERSGTYTAKSAYNAMIGGGKIRWEFYHTWRFKIPPTVKIFVYMLLRGKLLTHDVMCRRNFRCSPKCVLCDSCPIELALHLFFLCPYATHTWFSVANILGYPILKPAQSVHKVWRLSCQMIAHNQTRRQGEIGDHYSHQHVGYYGSTVIR